MAAVTFAKRCQPDERYFLFAGMRRMFCLFLSHQGSQKNCQTSNEHQQSQRVEKTASQAKDEHESDKSCPDQKASQAQSNILLFPDGLLPVQQYIIRFTRMGVKQVKSNKFEQKKTKNHFTNDEKFLQFSAKLNFKSGFFNT